MYIANEVTFIFVLYLSSVFAIESPIRTAEQESILLNEVLTELPHHQCDLLVVSSDLFKGEIAKLIRENIVSISCSHLVG